MLLLFGVVFYLHNANAYGASLDLDGTMLCLSDVIL